MKKNFIPGIYNYCDRWCERCTFTNRCRNYEGNSSLSEEEQDINNEAFWKNIAASFENAATLLQKAADEWGFDLNAISDEDMKQYEDKRAARDKATSEHELSILCKKYQKTTGPFIRKEIDNELVATARQLTSQVHMGITSPEETAHTMANLGDCANIIQWYLYFFDAKIQRALHGKMDDHDTGDLQSDSNGSAKIAIIAIERSMGAWQRWLELKPASEDIALPALSILSRIKQIALTTFPDAMRFVRPGFDNGE